MNQCSAHLCRAWEGRGSPRSPPRRRWRWRSRAGAGRGASGTWGRGRGPPTTRGTRRTGWTTRWVGSMYRVRVSKNLMLRNLPVQRCALHWFIYWVIGTFIRYVETFGRLNFAIGKHEWMKRLVDSLRLSTFYNREISNRELDKKFLNEKPKSMICLTKKSYLPGGRSYVYNICIAEEFFFTN